MAGPARGPSNVEQPHNEAEARPTVENSPIEIAHQSAVYYAAGDLGRAVRWLEAGVEVHPESAQLEFMLANALYRCEKLPDSIEHYERAAELRKLHPDTYLSLGAAYFQIGRIDDAMLTWRTAEQQASGDALAPLFLVVGMIKTGQSENARSLFRQILNTEPEWRKRIEIDIRWTPEMRRDLIELADKIQGKK